MSGPAFLRPPHGAGARRWQHRRCRPWPGPVAVGNRSVVFR